MPKNNSKEWLKMARDKWRYRGDERPPFAEVPKKGQRSVWDFPRPPIIEQVSKHITIKYDDFTIADSNSALAVLETASPPTYYIPKQDIEISLLLQIPGKASMCEWKGSASYWSLRRAPNIPIAWSYANPFSEFENLIEHLAFYPHHLDCRVDGVKVKPQAGLFYAGWITPDLVGPFKGETGTGHW
ncbi:MAG: DUF427 domain-containing protein [Bacteroidota bacterium]